MMSRIALLVAMTLLLTACSPKAVPAPVPASPNAPVAVEPEPPTVPPALAPVPEVLAHPLTQGGPERVTLHAGDTASKVGAYFLNVETGSGEAWLYPGPETGWSASVVSDDNRFVWETGGAGGYLIDRTAGAVWKWDDKRVRPLLMSDRGFLFAELEEKDRNLRDTGRYFWTGPDFKPIQVFPIDGEQQTASGALLSPDGQRLAFLLQGRNPLIALLDLGSDIQQLLVVPGADSWIGSVSLSATRDGFAVSVWVSGGNPATAMPQWHQLIRRYDWQGRVQSDLQIPGHYAFFSPDGRWVAWQESALLGDVAPVTVVAEAATLRPQLTVLGASPCFAVVGSGGNRWLADSSGLVLATTTNQYRLLTLDGSLQEPQGFAGRSWQGEPQPAPDKVDRIAFGRLEVLDGQRQLGVKLDGFVTPRGDDTWGRTSRELRFTLPPPARGSACYELPAMDSLVLKAGEPVPEFPLIVRSSACVSLQGTEPACLPQGTRLKPVPPGNGQPGLTWTDSWKLHVQTDTGQTGWIALSGNPVTWTR